MPGREAHPGVCEVLEFVEKPTSDAASKLIEQGGLWNTMVIVFKVKTLLDLVCRAAPEMYRFFADIFDAIGTASELDAINHAYRQIGVRACVHGPEGSWVRIKDREVRMREIPGQKDSAIRL